MNKIIKSSLWVSLLVAAANALAVAPAQVPATGETGGAIGSNKGVAWPSQRFVAGSGATADCITDKLTGLMWPKNGIIGFEVTDGGQLQTQPNYANTVATLNQTSWTNALTGIANMNTAPLKLCGYSDWRLPNKVELKSLINYGAAVPADWLMHGNGTACSGACFTNVQANFYWSSSTDASPPSNAWNVDFHYGYVDANGKTVSNYVWPVRGGQ